jgi:uncharacterized metal-binding protein
MSQKRKRGRPKKPRAGFKELGLAYFADSGMAAQNSADSNTNNFRANLVVLFLSLLIGFIYLVVTGGVGSLAEKYHFLFWFSAFYILFSYWLSPDVDHRVFRPGHHSFPLGPVKKALPYPIRRLFWPLLNPVHIFFNQLWRWLWMPVSVLFTHRGALHWPLLGTGIKLIYLAAVYTLVAVLWNHVISDLINLLLSSNSVKEIPLLFGDHSLLGNSWKEALGTVLHFPIIGIALVSWIVADLTHILVDFWDSAKQDPPTPFCSPRHPRGAFVVLFRHVRERRS